jgi:hypothetical protein
MSNKHLNIQTNNQTNKTKQIYIYIRQRTKTNWEHKIQSFESRITPHMYKLKVTKGKVPRK